MNETSQELNTPTDIQPEPAVLRTWVTPVFEREPMKDALSGISNTNDGFSCS